MQVKVWGFVIKCGNNIIINSSCPTTNTHPHKVHRHAAAEPRLCHPPHPDIRSSMGMSLSLNNFHPPTIRSIQTMLSFCESRRLQNFYKFLVIKFLIRSSSSSALSIVSSSFSDLISFMFSSCICVSFLPLSQAQQVESLF